MVKAGAEVLAAEVRATLAAAAEAVAMEVPSAGQVVTEEQRLDSDRLESH